MTVPQAPRSGRLSRREVMRLLGVGGGFGLASTWRADLLAAPLQGAVSSGRPLAGVPRGAIIRTLLKDLSPGAIGGVTLFHEHLSIELPPIAPQPAGAPPAPAPATRNVEYIIQEIRTAAKEGVGCIVDGGHADMGRDLNALKRIANETGVHIVASGGYYMERVYPPDIAKNSDDQIAEDLVREANANRYGAFGEIGQLPDMAGMTPNERKVFRAVGKAHVRTGIPIFTHNAYGTGPNVPPDAGLRQLDVLESVGVKPQNVVIGHACCLDDQTAAVLKQIARRGAFVGFDRVTGGRVPDDKKVTTILALLEAGYADKILVCSDFTGNRTPARPGYGNTVTVFAPLLRKAGVKEDTLQSILYDTPRRFLAFVPRKA